MLLWKPRYIASARTTQKTLPSVVSVIDEDPKIEIETRNVSNK
jgi:hypothetical protein